MVTGLFAGWEQTSLWVTWLTICREEKTGVVWLSAFQTWFSFFFFLSFLTLSTPATFTLIVSLHSLFLDFSFTTYESFSLNIFPFSIPSFPILRPLRFTYFVMRNGDVGKYKKKKSIDRRCPRSRGQKTTENLNNSNIKIVRQRRHQLYFLSFYYTSNLI